MISSNRISKIFGHLRALDEVSFQIDRGECVALMGANGAGKTTLLLILAGLSRATAGTAIVSGYRIDKEADNVRRHIGLVGHQPLLYNDLSAEENLRFYGKMYRVPQLSRRIDELLDWIQLRHRRNDLLRTFSRGMQQRLALARAILHQPPILLLDEPFTGLDVHATELLNSYLARFREQKLTILFTTHDLDYAFHHAQRLLLLQKGRLIVDTAIKTINRRMIAELLQESTT